MPLVPILSPDVEKLALFSTFQHFSAPWICPEKAAIQEACYGGLLTWAISIVLKTKILTPFTKKKLAAFIWNFHLRPKSYSQNIFILFSKMETLYYDTSDKLPLSMFVLFLSSILWMRVVSWSVMEPKQRYMMSLMMQKGGKLSKFTNVPQTMRSKIE